MLNLPLTSALMVLALTAAPLSVVSPLEVRLTVLAVSSVLL